MGTFVRANIGLAPFTLFWLMLDYLGLGIAMAGGVVASFAVVGWRLRNGALPILEAGGAGFFAVLAVAWISAPSPVAANALWLSFAGVGVLALVSVVLRRPWTAEYARTEYAAESETPIFHWVNTIVSAFWGVLFLVGALLAAGGVDSWATTALFVFGALASVVGPNSLIRWAVQRQIDAAESYRWPAPKLGGAEKTGAIDVAIVGAGIGGLTAAALLADAGLKVAVYESHVVPGGFCHGFFRKTRREGRPCLYRFDAGPHDFSGLFPGGPVASTLERLGVADRIEWRRLDHRYRLAGLTIDPPSDWREYARLLGRLFPADAAGFEALFIEIRAIYDGMYDGAANHGGIPGLPVGVEAMLAFPRQHPLTARWIDRPFDELVALHIRGAEGRKALSVLTGYISDGRDSPSCERMVPLFGYYFHGGYYPVGGSERVAQALVEAIEARGGSVHLKRRVDQILVEDGRAAGLRLADGTRVDAAAVVANSDLKRTFLELVDGRHLPVDFLDRVRSAEPAPSAFMVHLGVDYVPEGPPAIHVEDDFDCGVEILSKLDPTAAPPGHSTVGIIRLLSHAEAKAWFGAEAGDGWEKLRSSPEYAARKRELGDRLVAAAESALPGLSRHIVFRSEASPVTYARYDLSTAGAIYGVAGKGRLKGAKSPIPGLVVAGAATHGPGVEAVVISGAVAAEALVPGLLARPLPGTSPSATPLAAPRAPASLTPGRIRP